MSEETIESKIVLIEAYRERALLWRDLGDSAAMFRTLNADALPAHRFSKYMESWLNNSARELLGEAIDERACKMES